NHFKLKENIALLTLLDYAFANATYEMDVFPLLKFYWITKEEYKMVVEFVLASCAPTEWEEPIELLQDTMFSPIIAAISLYLLKSECTAGKLAVIPWESLDRNLTTFPIEYLQKFDLQMLEGFKELAKNDESKKKDEEMMKRLKNATKFLLDVKSEMRSLKQQLSLRRNELNELSRTYVVNLAKRKEHIGQIIPSNFDEKGVELADDEDVICLSRKRPSDVTSRLSSFNRNQYLRKQDFLVVEDMVVLARKKDDAPEKFQRAKVMTQNEDGSWNVRFSDDSITSIPLSAMAAYQPMKGKTPISSEGVRVAARARHPCRPNDAAALYSGTIISRFDLQTEEYAVAFDDSFEEYVGLNEMHLMMTQPFNEHDVWNRSFVHHLITPNEKTPDPSDERKLFLLLFFATYPEWNMV
ncbi:hypothetical protein PENTCL1PPCAC_13181, partial [Pristionchus entomophagus]